LRRLERHQELIFRVNYTPTSKSDKQLIFKHTKKQLLLFKTLFVLNVHNIGQLVALEHL